MAAPQVTPLVEALHDGGFIVDCERFRSFDTVTLLSGSGKVKPGTVLGQATAALSATAAALGTNTGNGTFGAIVATPVPTQIGVYTALFTAATTYVVTAPDGATSPGTTGVAFSALGVGFTITAGGTAFVAGDKFTVTATDAVGKPNVVSAPGANTGNGTLGTLTSTGYPATVGPYTVEFDDATHFIVNSPAGIEVGHGTTGVAFSAGGLGFTITAGGTAFVPGDSFVVTVAAGSGKYRPWDPGNADGSNVVAGVLVYFKDASSADKSATALRRLATVNPNELIWPTGMSAAAIAIGVAGLAALGIFTAPH